MENATERLTRLADHGKESGHVRARSGVGLNNFDLSSGVAQLLNKGFSFRRRRAAAAGHNEMARARLDKPIGHHFAEPAERTGDQVTALRFDIELRRDGLAAPGDK